MTEEIILSGNEETLKPVITLLIALRQMLDNTSNNSTEEIISPRRRDKVRIKLYFLEDIADIEPGYRRLDGTITFRLMNETDETITNSELKNYATKIKNIFGSSGGLIWKKGKVMYSYSDWEKGYQLQLCCRNISSAKNLVEQVFSIQNHKPDWKFLNIEENAEPPQRYPTIPKTRTILGKTVRESRERPICEVRFKEAMYKIPGLKNWGCLYDRTGTRQNPVLKR